MARDGGLGPMFRKNIPEAHWQSVETWSTGRGVPDLNYCIDGNEGWIELKSIDGWKLNMRPEQTAWISQRIRYGGRVLIAVRRKEDELWMFHGSVVREFKFIGIDKVFNLGKFTRPWDWNAIREML